MNMKNSDFSKELLYKKVNDEFKDYLDNLKTRDKDSIIRNSYETTMRESIVDLFDPHYYFGNNEEVKALIKKDNLLDYLYRRWMKSDCNLIDIFKESILYEIEQIKKDYLEQKDETKQKNKNVRMR